MNPQNTELETLRLELAKLRDERDEALAKNETLKVDCQASMDYWTSEEKRMRELYHQSEHERGVERQGATWIQNDLIAERDAALARVGKAEKVLGNIAYGEGFIEELRDAARTFLETKGDKTV